MIKDKIEEKTFEEKAQSEEWGAWKFVSDMLDNPDENGIYQTSKCYEQIHDFVVNQKKKLAKEVADEMMLEEKQIKINIPDTLHFNSGYNQAVQDLKSKRRYF
jgi:hypothetical protein